MIIQIVRDLRTGGPYDAEKDKAENGSYLHEAPDIEVEVGVCGLYKGTNSIDDPDSADVGNEARVCQDVQKWNPLTNEMIDEVLFRAHQIIKLTEEEIADAHEQAIEEARAEAEPEYSYNF